jgi:hypothetical protein
MKSVRAKNSELRIFLQQSGQIFSHLRHEIDADDVAQPERGALGPADSGTGDGIDFIDRAVLPEPSATAHVAYQSSQCGWQRKPGVSLASTVPFPSTDSANSPKDFSNAGSVSLVGINSSNRM